MDRAGVFERRIAADGVLGSAWRLVRVGAHHIKKASAAISERARFRLPLNATYGAPEPTHGSPAIMVRMSVRHCVEISSRGDGVRLVLAMCSLHIKGGKNAAAAHPAGQSTTSPHHSCTADRRTDHGSRCRDLQSHRGSGASAALEAGARLPPHTHKTKPRAPSLTSTKHRSSRTASSPSRTPRSAASARC